MLIAMVIAAGLSFCKIASIPPHTHELLMAAVVFLLAAQIALLPLFMLRQPNAMQLTRSALLGLVLHLFAAIVLAVAAMLALRPSVAFAVWTLIFYWTTLTGLAFVFVRAVQSTPATRAQE
jgi:hypothetical protein